jgi:hypothetical protein
LASLAAMKFLNKPLPVPLSRAIYSVASLPCSPKTRAGSIINFYFFKLNVMEQNAMNQPAWSKVTEVELVYKTKVKTSERPLIKTFKDCYQTFLKVWDENRMEMQEEFKVLLINRANLVAGVYEHLPEGLWKNA